MKTYWVYILASRTRALYVGVTNNLQRRLWEHRTGDGSAHAFRYREVKLVWCKVFGRQRRDREREADQELAPRKEDSPHRAEESGVARSRADVIPSVARDLGGVRCTNRGLCLPTLPDPSAASRHRDDMPPYGPTPTVVLSGTWIG